MFASLFLGEENRYRQTVFFIANQIHRKAYVWNMSETGQNKDSEKLLQTTSAL